MADIIKAGVFPIKNKKVLVVRKRGHDFYISLGGKNEPGENDKTCLEREVHEELRCGIANLEHLATFEGPVHDDRTKTIRMACYLGDLVGEPQLNPEDKIIEYRWIGRNYAQEGIKIAHLMEFYVIPNLIKQHLL